MVSGVLTDLLALLLVFAFILYIFSYRSFIFLIVNPIVYVLHPILAISLGMLLFIPRLIVGLLKATLVGSSALILALIYGTTFVIPYVGKWTASWRIATEDSPVMLYVRYHLRMMREVMVRIVAEEDDRNLAFENPIDYRQEFEQVKQQSKNRLERGETVLSILLGAVLLATKLAGVGLFQSSIYGVSTSSLIELWLLILAVSIIYRTTVLEFLAYDSDAEFDSLSEMDAALGYQRGVSLVGFVQGLMFLVMLMSAVVGRRHSLIEDILRAKYTDGNWVSLAWKRLTD